MAETNYCLGFHDWPRWGEVQVAARLINGEYVGQFKYQERTCRRCGKTKQRKVK